MSLDAGFISTTIHPSLFPQHPPHPTSSMFHLSWANLYALGIPCHVALNQNKSQDSGSTWKQPIHLSRLSGKKVCIVGNNKLLSTHSEITLVECALVRRFLRVFSHFTCLFFIYTCYMLEYTDVRRINSSPVRTFLFRIADMQGNYGMLVVLPL